MDTKKLREYLENVRILEEDIYTVEYAIKKLELAKKVIPIYQKTRPEAPTRPHEPVQMTATEQEAYDTWIAAKIQSNKTAGRKSLLEKLLHGGTEDNRDLYQGTDFWDYCVATNSDINHYPAHLYEYQKKVYDRSMREYSRSYSIYLDEIRLFQNEERQHNEEIVRVNQYNALLAKEIADLVETREKSMSALSQLYSLDIVYRKYQEWIPITMFCENMDSGRRTELSGVNGMYDLYEQELLGKKILDGLGDINSNLVQINSQLGNISRQLTGIQRNQILVYEEVARGNEIANRIFNNTNRLLEQAVIQNNNTGEIINTLHDIRKSVSSIDSDFNASNYRLQMLQRSADSIAKIEQYEFSLRHPLFQSP